MTLDHPIFSRWPAQYPDRLQLFSTPTPNGVKIGIMLEETSLAYEPHRIDIMADENRDPAFLSLNPNGKIPAIYDPDGPSGTPRQFISVDPNIRYVFGQVGFFPNSPARPMKTSVRATATQPNQRGCSVSSTNGSRAATG